MFSAISAWLLGQPAEAGGHEEMASGADTTGRDDEAEDQHRPRQPPGL